MATLDLSRATTRINMTDTNLAKFGTAELATAESWSFDNGQSDDLQFDGSGMTFDSNGRALGGTVTRVSIDLGNDDLDNPDILITGISAAAQSLDDGSSKFWSTLLAGDDTIIAPSYSASNQPHALFGDALEGQAGGTGGNDTFNLGSALVYAAGDAWSVGPLGAGLTAAATSYAYSGGDDLMVTEPTTDNQVLMGDVNGVYPSGTLLGGDDTLLIRGDGNSAVATAIGDAYSAYGSSTGSSTIRGGDDTIISTGTTWSVLVGDVFSQGGYTVVEGGDDVLSGSDAADDLVGDVRYVDGGKLTGGNDVLWGYGGDDFLYGDTLAIDNNAVSVSAGNDTLRGGNGNDTLYGDAIELKKVTGGHDKLYGDAGADTIWGGTGNDLLDGGSGTDQLRGGAGNDTYVMDVDFVMENANEGTDTILTSVNDLALPQNIENLTYTGSDYFNGTGNNLANTIKGGVAADILLGGGGADKLFGGGSNDWLFGETQDDVLVGGAGADKLHGGDGLDFASYEGSEAGVTVSLDGGITAKGDAVGDTFTSIEGLRGSSYADTLRGNAEANRIEGGAGNDILSGRGGGDYLTGGAGRDSMTGGADGDRFVFKAVSDSGITATTRDVILDFTKGQDNIDLSLIDANAGTTSNDVFKLLAKGTATSAVATGQIGWYQENLSGTANDKTILRINNDADAAIDMTIEIKGLVSFTSADFIL